MIRYTFKSMNNFTYMTKFRLNTAMFFVLVTAFLSMQWAPAHIHLAEHHDHGGSHHQHEVEAHAHLSITQDDNPNSSTFQTDKHDINVVEIDHQCNTKSGSHLDDQFIASTSYDFHLSFPPIKNSLESTKFNSSKLRYIDYTTIHGRAPPTVS